MFCPRCSLEQTSENLRFCSSCGLPLDIVSEVVDHGGNPEHFLEVLQKRPFFTRRNGLFASLIWLLIVVFFLVPIFIMIDGDEDVVAILAVIGLFFSGVLATISLFLGKSEKTVQTKNTAAGATLQSREFTTSTAVASLEAGQNVPARDYVSPDVANKRYETGEMAPSSVVEQTTKLLEKEDK